MTILIDTQPLGIKKFKDIGLACSKCQQFVEFDSPVDIAELVDVANKHLDVCEKQ